MKFALKKLTRSDLTFIEPLFRRLNAGNQKSINLNAAVFVDELFPSISTVAKQLDNEIPIKLSIFGPDGSPEYRLARKVVKGQAYKNWRLNGEFVRDPEDQPGRFDALEPDDLALMAFNGDLAPDSLRLVFLARKAAADLAAFDVLDPLVATRSMVALTPAELESLSVLSADHPAVQLMLGEGSQADLIDASFGTAGPTRKVWGLGKLRRITQADVRRSRERAAEIGSQGEAAVNLYLTSMVAGGKLTELVWVSQQNALSPFDFRFIQAGTTVEIDVKATTELFVRPFHMSAAEVQYAANSETPYQIYRVYNVGQNRVYLRRSADIRTFCQELTAKLVGFPDGVVPDSFSIEPVCVEWSDEEEIELSEQD